MFVFRRVVLLLLFLGFFLTSLLGIFSVLPFAAWYQRGATCQESKFVRTMLLRDQQGIWARGGFLAESFTNQGCYRTYKDYRVLQEAGWTELWSYLEDRSPYISHPRLGSFLLHPFWRASQRFFADHEDRLYIGVWTLRAITALSTALALWLLCLWLVRETSLFSGLFVGLGLMVLPLMPVLLYTMGRNPMHKPFFLFLPFLLTAFLLQSAWRKRASVPLSVAVVCLLGGLASLVSFFFGEGYDLLATVMVSATIPVFWYAVREKWSFERFALWFGCLSLAVVVGVGAAVVLHGVQANAIGVDFLAYAKQRALFRAHGFDETGGMLRCEDADIVRALPSYLQGSCKSYVAVVFDSLLYQLPFLVLCSLCCSFRSVRLDLRMRLRDPRFRALWRAVLVAVGVGALAAVAQPLTWKQSTYMHDYLKVSCWLLMFRPFALLALALLLEPALLRWSSHALERWRRNIEAC